MFHAVPAHDPRPACQAMDFLLLALVTVLVRDGPAGMTTGARADERERESFLFLRSLLVSTSKALVTSSVALVPSRERDLYTGTGWEDVRTGGMTCGDSLHLVGFSTWSRSTMSPKKNRSTWGAVLWNEVTLAPFQKGSSLLDAWRKLMHLMQKARTS